MEVKTKRTAPFDFTDFISQDEAKQLLGFKPETSNSNRKMNELVRSGKITAFQPSKKNRFYSRESIMKYILSTRIPSDSEFIPVRIKNAG